MTKKHTFPLRDINGNDPVRSLYSTPVCLSANAEKQKIFSLESSSSGSINVATLGCGAMATSSESLNDLECIKGTIP
jgi:hypothetical protein